MFPKASAANNWYYNPELKEFAKKHRNQSTKAEIKIWQTVLSSKQMMGYSFTRQRPIKNYIVDFFCKALLLVIEVDGLSHQFEEIHKKDLEREKALKALGLSILRFDDNMVLNEIDAVSRQIELWIEENAS